MEPDKTTPVKTEPDPAISIKKEPDEEAPPSAPAPTPRFLCAGNAAPVKFSSHRTYLPHRSIEKTTAKTSQPPTLSQSARPPPSLPHKTAARAPTTPLGRGAALTSPLPSGPECSKGRVRVWLASKPIASRARGNLLAVARRCVRLRRRGRCGGGMARWCREGLVRELGGCRSRAGLAKRTLLTLLLTRRRTRRMIVRVRVRVRSDLAGRRGA